MPCLQGTGSMRLTTLKLWCLDLSAISMLARGSRLYLSGLEPRPPSRLPPKRRRDLGSKLICISPVMTGINES